MQNFRKFLLPVFVALALMSCNDGFNKVMKSKDANYKLQKANEYFAKGKYKNAQTLYEELFTQFKGTEQYQDLYYKYAFTAFNLKQYEQAEAYFKGYLDVFPNSAAAEEMQYMRAYSFYKQSPKVELEQVNTIKAMNRMQAFINAYPNSTRVKDAEKIIEEGRAKLELKDYKSATLYYNLQSYRAAAIAFSELLNKYPETEKGETYKLQAIKSYYKFAELSFQDKQQERFEKVISEVQDFHDRFPESKLLSEVDQYSNNSQKKIKELNNEQIASSAQR